MLYAIFFNLFFLYRIYDGITENFVLFYSTTMCALCTGEHKKLRNVFLALLPIFMMIIRLSNYFEIAYKHIQLNIFLYDVHFTVHTYSDILCACLLQQISSFVVQAFCIIVKVFQCICRNVSIWFAFYMQ